MPDLGQDGCVLGAAVANVASRLIGAAYDQASGRKKRGGPVFVSLDEDMPALPEQTDWPWSEDGPRRVLDRLVRSIRDLGDGQRITSTDAMLIARTYLDGDTLRQVAADLGMSESNASKRRSRAETLIARHLGRADLTGQPPS
jgi:DNA-directed RNA polymerase specialized sigma24 family protein